MAMQAKTRILCKGVKRQPLIVVLVLFSAVVSVDGRPVRLQLCDTAGQVSIVSLSELGEETACSRPPVTSCGNWVTLRPVEQPQPCCGPLSGAGVVAMAPH